MAGLGKRFSDAGFKELKYKIEVHGHSLFFWAITSLQNFIHSKNTFIFVAKKKNGVLDFIKNECSSIGISQYEIIELSSSTDGQATSALHASNKIDDFNEPVIIYNIDTYVEPQYLRTEDIHGWGWLPCFPGKGNHWSFARIGPYGIVDLVREKKRISPHATIGLYYFRSFNLYKEMYDEYYSDPTNIEPKERYIAPLYNQLIANGLTVYITQIPFKAVHVLGTPRELKEFEVNYYYQKE